ncbi:hypothetical protein CW751_08835 [Brumimicrobium salinarum]|uniref:Lipoprotein n=1 Tax=Brumimicrobium salinarum TaxID=2058658 RepID=A0A2I0R1M6_9FLAO|nr:hypothetical protein [Brumimicrobium salinarum]PKR80472.1 hypothetical protein CW751_08835 [Brumimicrobium salinarum]
MRKILYTALITSLFLIGCKNENTLSKQEINSFLKICFEDYYLNFDVEITALLNDFEHHLVKEGHLKDTTGKSYKKLLKSLQKNSYFNPPLEKNNFNEVLLYANPSNIIACVKETFAIDSVEIVKTKFHKISMTIKNEIEKKEDLSIHFIFEQYINELKNSEFKYDYNKQSIQLLLYRWYFKSKNVLNAKETDYSPKEKHIKR